MPTYPVVWRIDIEAESPEAAVLQARDIQRDPDSIATFFEVQLEDDSITIMDADELELLAKPPIVYDSLPADDPNGMMDRYTIFYQHGTFADHPGDYLGCSIGGRAFSQWGSLDPESGFNHLGRQVPFEELDEDTRNHIIRRVT